jgi:hypothetical protein
MSYEDQSDAAFLQNRASHYRQLAERQTDENLAKHYRHLADVFDGRAKGRESDQTLKRPQERRGARVAFEPKSSAK